jgi:hypothetical protein
MIAADPHFIRLFKMFRKELLKGHRKIWTEPAEAWSIQIHQPECRLVGARSHVGARVTKNDKANLDWRQIGGIQAAPPVETRETLRKVRMTTSTAEALAPRSTKNRSNSFAFTDTTPNVETTLAALRRFYNRKVERAANFRQRPARLSRDVGFERFPTR